MCAIRFRWYFRERATDFQILDAITTFEEASTRTKAHSTSFITPDLGSGDHMGEPRPVAPLSEDASGLAKTVSLGAWI